jgi:hypothetical protein
MFFSGEAAEKHTNPLVVEMTSSNRLNIFDLHIAV